MAGLPRLARLVRLQSARSAGRRRSRPRRARLPRVPQGAGVVHAAGRRTLAAARFRRRGQRAPRSRASTPRDVAGFAAFDARRVRLGAALFDSFADAEPSFARFDAATRATLEGSVADLVERYVRTPVLQATLATDGLIGTGAGPRDAGTAYVLAHHYAGRALGVQGAWGFVRGGMGAISKPPPPPPRAPPARRCAPTARWNASRVRDGRAARLELRDGTTIDARGDPRQRGSEDAVPAPARTRRRAAGAARARDGVALQRRFAEDQPRARRAARFHARGRARTSSRIIARRSTSRRRSRSCSTPTTTRGSSARRANRCSSASCKPRPIRRWRRPENTSSRSSHSTFRTTGATGPWEPGDGDAMADRIVDQLAAYAPNLPGAIEHRQILAPPDLEATLGLTGGHIFHGELLPGQIYEDRFGVRTRYRRPVSVRFGNASRRLRQRFPRPARGPGRDRRPGPGVRMT